LFFTSTLQASQTQELTGGRPKSKLVSQALHDRLAQINEADPEKRSWAEIVVSNLIELATSKSPSAVAAANEICDRAEGRPAQHVQISDFIADLQSRSDAELHFHLANGRWPSDREGTVLRASECTDDITVEAVLRRGSFF
jgi:hypothetical protein